MPGEVRHGADFGLARDEPNVDVGRQVTGVDSLGRVRQAHDERVAAAYEFAIACHSSSRVAISAAR